MHRVIQLCTALFLSLYTYLTLPVYSNNFIWCIASLLLLLFGTLRKPRESLFAAGLVLLGYGGYELYLYYTAEPAITLGWNELIWLLVFPYAAIIGGISQYAGKTSRPNGLSLYNMLHADEQAGVTEISTVDAQLEYMSGSAFVYKLEEEVLVALRERRKIALVLVEIHRFPEYKQVFGFDQSQWLLNQVAELIVRLPSPPAIKAHLGEGVLAVTLNKKDDANNADLAAAFKRDLGNAFTEMIMLRPRQENVVKVSLKYGAAECPADGIEARTLMDHAQSELEGEDIQR